MLMSDPAPLCCFLLMFSPVESCSGYITDKSLPCVPENPQDLNSLGADDTVVTLSFIFSVSFETLTTQPAHFIKPFAFYHSKPAPSEHTFGKGIQNDVFILLQCQKAVIH